MRSVASQILLEFDGLLPYTLHWKGCIFQEWTYCRYRRFLDVNLVTKNLSASLCATLLHSVDGLLPEKPQDYISIANFFMGLSEPLLEKLSTTLLKVFPIPNYDSLLLLADPTKFEGLTWCSSCNTNFFTTRLSTNLQLYQKEQEFKRLESILGTFWKAEDFVSNTNDDEIEGELSMEFPSQIRTPLSVLLVPSLLKEIKQRLGPKIAELREDQQVVDLLKAKTGDSKAETKVATSTRNLSLPQLEKIGNKGPVRTVPLWYVKKEDFVRIMQEYGQPAPKSDEGVKAEEGVSFAPTANKVDIIRHRRK